MEDRVKKIYTYNFYGKIHPGRVNFSVNHILPFHLKNDYFKINEEISLTFEKSKIIAELHSSVDYVKNEKCNLETLKNYIEEVSRLVVSVYCYIKSYHYDIEITKVECKELSIDYIFGVQGEWNIKKDEKTTNKELGKILKLFEKPNSTFLKDVLSDFCRAIKYPAMTASFCFRSIEIIRKFYFEDINQSDDKKRRKDGWAKLNKELGLHQADFDEIKKFALPNRHGDYPGISYPERERIMNFTRSVIDNLIEKIDK